MERETRLRLIGQHRLPVFDIPMLSVGVLYCTTQLSNTHNTSERLVLYDHHPWAGLDVQMLGYVERSRISFARCRLRGDERCLPLELPLWMFDRVACSSIRSERLPEVDLSSLLALQILLGEFTGSGIADCQDFSTAPDLSADLMFYGQNQENRHAPISTEAKTVGPVRPAARNVCVADTAMADPAVPNAQRSDLARCATADGTRPRGKKRTRWGSCRSTPEQGER